MKNSYTFFLTLWLMIILFGCKEMETRIPIGNDADKPGLVSNVTVTNKNGSALITYVVPEDSDLQYVKATYKVNGKGTIRESRASRYDNKVVVEGFENSADYTVQLVAVDKSENEGDPVTVTVRPDIPPYLMARKSLLTAATFGGLAVKFKNPLKAKLAIVVVTDDLNKALVPAFSYYSAADSGAFAARGFEPMLRRFGVYVRDQFGNFSDTTYMTVTPWAEKELDKTKFREYALPTDAKTFPGWVMPNLWNGVVTGNGYHTPNGAAIMPMHFSFDLGATYLLSRFKIYQRSGPTYIYQFGNPRKWVMWGSNAPDPTGTYNGWTKLMDCESIKPSGSPNGETTPDDLTYAARGEEFLFPDGLPPVRYIRFQMTQSWGSGDFFHAMEITFWGN